MEAIPRAQQYFVPNNFPTDANPLMIAHILANRTTTYSARAHHEMYSTDSISGMSHQGAQALFCHSEGACKTRLIVDIEFDIEDTLGS